MKWEKETERMSERKGKGKGDVAKGWHDAILVAAAVSVARNKSGSSRCRQPQGRDKMEMHCALHARIREYEAQHTYMYICVRALYVHTRGASDNVSRAEDDSFSYWCSNGYDPGISCDTM